MKGTLLEFNRDINEGIILGNDGLRYSFFGQQWKDELPPLVGVYVNFMVNDLNQAINIYIEQMVNETSFVPLESRVDFDQDLVYQQQLEAEKAYGFFDWVIKCFKNYANFKGRARRKEFWYFYLFQILVSFVFTVFFNLLNFSQDAVDFINAIIGLFFLLPTISVTVRRLHDVNRSGWWYLIVFTIIGIIPYLIWMCMNTKNNKNQWGLPAKLNE